MNQFGVFLKSLAMMLAAGLLFSASLANADSMTATKEGFAETDDGVQIHYRLLGPSDAPTLWVGYPWTEGWDRIMQELGSTSSSTEISRQLLELLTTKYQVLHVDYPRGTGRSTGPLPEDIKPETVAKDYVAVADAAGVDRFVAMGYSWGAGIGIQVASRTKRCAGLAIGGWPVLGAPYEQILISSGASSSGLPTDTAAGKVLRSNTRFYADIVNSNWSEEDAVESMRDRAGLLYLYVGSEDMGVPSMNMSLPIASPIVAHKEQLEAAGWKVEVIEGYGHMDLPLDAWVPGVMDFLKGKSW